LLLAHILASRPEPVSRNKAMKLLEQLTSDKPLDLESELILGQLYFSVGNWQKCRTQMRQTISSFPTSVDARATYIQMILQRGEKSNYSDAMQQLAKLQEIAPGDAQTIQLMVRLYARAGKKQDARAYLLRLLPKVTDPKQLDEKQLGLMEFVATLLVDLGDLDDAEKIFRAIVAREPRKTLALAGFLGEHRDVQQCMDLLDSAYKPELAEATARVAIGVVRARRDDVGDKYDDQVKGWLDRALLENPDSMPLLMLQAEFDDVRKDYDGAAEIYLKLLGRSELTGITRAIVLNNLAFLVALAESETETGVDPMKLVQEAAQILGPTADILDTRAVVYIAQKDYEGAIRDLNYSVTDNPTRSKYFHLAVAHLAAGENKAALEAWEKAEQLGDIRSDLNRMEYDRYEEIKSKIEQLRSQNAKLTDTKRYQAAR
jgi:tetratricopeptide (TPR) repeat protein